MPVLKRIIEPKNVSRGVVPPNISNELEYVSNSTLAHIILQLSSLSKHSEDLFGKLHQETSCILYRTSQLNERIEHLKRKIVQLNPILEEVSLQDISMRKPFKSSVIKEHQIITVHTRPQAIAEVYALVDPAPPLQILNPYREDRKDSLKFYTDPGYFFELWSQEITKDAENQIKKHKHRKGRTVQRPNKEPPPVRLSKTHRDDDKKISEGKFEQDNGLIQTDQVKPSRIHQTLSPGKSASNVQKIRRGSSLSKHDRDSVVAGDICPTPPGSASPKYSKTQFAYPSTGMEKNEERNQTVSHSSPGGLAERRRRGDLPPLPYGLNDCVPGSPLPSNSQQLNQFSGNAGRSSYWDGSSYPQYGNVSPRGIPADKHFSVIQWTHATGHLAENWHLGNRRPTNEAVSPKNRSRESMDLPLPPTPPMELPPSSDPMPSPPPMPSPMTGPPLENSLPSSPLLPPPLYEADYSFKDRFPLDYAVVISKEHGKHKFSNEDRITGIVIQEDAEGRCNPTDTEDGTAADRDHRSDLLAAIRKGIRLQKVEERRLKTARKQKTTSKGPLDVQSIMEAAFEMRRKALEENDSDDDDDGELDNNWSDDN